MINVTKTFLPPFEEYTAMLKWAWDKTWITNNGDLSRELEQKLQDYLKVENLLFCTNGTVVLQIALKALKITGEVITTPFSYVATTSAIIWENCTPVFVDISDKTFCIDHSKIEAAITPKTQAILATHVYGYPCNVEEIEKIAKNYNLKVIYDAAHAFGTMVNNKSLLNYGDISTCSFHATKLFHTGEGGCLVTRDKLMMRQLFLYSHFGHIGDEYFSIGINGKNSEMHAALGLCNLKYIDSILENRKEQWQYYDELLSHSSVKTLSLDPAIKYNFAYFPAVFPSESILMNVIDELNASDIFPRRYFYPALNTLPYVPNSKCAVAEDISKRVCCLPMYHDLQREQQSMIVDIIFKGLKK